MAFILTGAKETCSFNGTKFTCAGAASGAYTTVKNALGKAYNKSTGLTTSVSDGKVGWFRVQYIDQSYLTHFAVFQGTYADSDTSVTPVSGSVVLSSNGSSLPDFDQGTASLYIFGATPNEAIGFRSLQKRTGAITSGLVTTGSATTMTRASNAEVVTPSSGDTSLIVSWSASGKSARDGTLSGSFAQFEMQLGYVNSSTVDTTIGELKKHGTGQGSSTTTLFVEGVVSGFSTLTQDELNSGGNWEFMPMYLVSGAVQDFDLDSFDFKIEEVI